MSSKAAKPRGKRSATVAPSRRVASKKVHALVPVKSLKIQKIDADLAEIAASVKSGHQSFHDKMTEATRLAAETGEKLVQADKLLDKRGQHGGVLGFKKWVTEECGFSVRTAYNYMELYRNCLKRPELAQKRLTEAYFEIGVRKAVQALPHPAPGPAPASNSSSNRAPQPASREPRTIEGVATAVTITDNSYDVIPVRLGRGIEFNLQLNKSDLDQFRNKGVRTIMEAMNVALREFLRNHASPS